MLTLLIRHVANSSSKVFIQSFPTTSSTSFSSSSTHNIGNLAKLWLFRTNRIDLIIRDGKNVLKHHLFASLRGTGRSLRLFGISLGFLPHFIKLAKCEQQTAATSRIGHLHSARNAQQHLLVSSVSWAEFWSLIRPYFGWILFAAMAAAAVAAFNIHIPILLGQLVNQISAFLTHNTAATPNDIAPAVNLDFGPLKPIAIQLVVAYVGQAVATFFCIASLSWMGEKMSADLRVRLFSHLLDFPMPFFDAQHSGELSDRLNYDVQEFKSAFKNCTIQGLRTMAQSIGCVLSLYMLSPQMTLLTVGIVPVVVAMGAIFGKILRRLSFRAQVQNGIASGVAGEAFQNIRTVKIFAMEEAEASLYRNEIKSARALSAELGLGIAVFQAVSNLFLNGIVLGVLYGGGQMVASNALSPGDLMAFLASAQTIQRSLAQLSLVFDNWVKAWASCARIMEFLRFEPKYGRGGNRRIPWHSLAGQIELEGVHFWYPTRMGHEVLNGLNMRIGAGQTVAICGPSGAGKSTVASLIERLYEPQAGQITLDGLDMRQLDPKWLRREAIGVISQEPVLFSTSIRENIRYGRMDATEKEIRDAAELANADQFIEQFPHGYDTMVGERGVTLSGGQKQRIAIARALIKNPPILLLDEATSALDTESERLVQQALSRVMRDRTVIIIAHRLSTIRNADCIYVLKDGRVVEQGTHSQLVQNRHGTYYGLVQEQHADAERAETDGG